MGDGLSLDEAAVEEVAVAAYDEVGHGHEGSVGGAGGADDAEALGAAAEGLGSASVAGALFGMKEEVFDHCPDIVYAALGKAKRLKALISAEPRWEEKERELHLLCQSLREGGAFDEEDLCSKFQLEQCWGVKSDQAEVLWALMKSLGATAVKDGCDLVRIHDLAQVAFISLVVKQATMKKRRNKKKDLLANERREEGGEAASTAADEDQKEGAGGENGTGVRPNTFALVMEHLDSLLRLILGVPPTCMSSSLVVTSSDVDALGVWLRPREAAGAGGALQISDYSPFFVSRLHASFKDVSDWLKAKVAVTRGVQGAVEGEGARLGHGRPAATVEVCQCSKETVVKQRLAAAKVAPLRSQGGASDGAGGPAAPTCARVTDCKDATIYLLFPADFLLISNCTNCTIFAGAATFAQTLHSSHLKVVAACRTKVISNCSDCAFFLGANECPLLIGDNRHVSLAPYNARYANLASDLAAASLSGEVNYWNLPKVIDSPYADAQEHAGVFSIMAPEKWTVFSVPFLPPGQSDFGGSGESMDSAAALAAPSAFSAPKAYQRSAETVAASVDGVRAKIANANLGDKEQQELQQVIQIHFKDWLMKNDHFSEVQCLTQMEQQ